MALSCLALFIYSAIVSPLLGRYIALPIIPGGISATVIFMMLFSIFHACYMLGWRHAMAFLILTIAISWLYEQVGVQTGLIYGHYHYTDRLGMKIGSVPAVIPIAWFMMAYPSYMIANLIIHGPITITTKRRRKRIETTNCTIQRNRKEGKKLSRSLVNMVWLSLECNSNGCLGYSS